MYSLHLRKLNDHVRGITLSNGLAWDDHLNKFYYIDSFASTIDAFDFDNTNGTICRYIHIFIFNYNIAFYCFLANRTTVFTVRKEKTIFKGLPDGMTIDIDGNLWVALFGLSKVIKIDPRKPETLLQTIDIPAKQVCIFISFFCQCFIVKVNCFCLWLKAHKYKYKPFYIKLGPN